MRVSGWSNMKSLTVDPSLPTYCIFMQYSVPPGANTFSLICSAAWPNVTFISLGTPPTNTHIESN